ncbi:thiosulfate oxidation carrier protein SoxY [Salaquimonas pukyongi]|uniref:thiosulfate oxidation carrier protein SoxY n=1 Tax=Salaquimonas pukyongi TaxID=2712698 RepID=UPI00096BC559|nr:thiosulfate oxidation carrier protein SoxY [Salaquimonas pukyongi]
MKMNRRHAMAMSAGAVVFAATGLSSTRALATAEDVDKAMMQLGGGKMPEAGKVTLTAPEIAENGNTVPISVEVDSAMSDGDMVSSVTIYAEGNPNPDVVTFNFSAMSGTATASTRMRLAKTQNVVAVAKMADGSTYMDKKEVKVTIGGCGG